MPKQRFYRGHVDTKIAHNDRLWVYPLVLLVALTFAMVLENRSFAMDTKSLDSNNSYFNLTQKQKGTRHAAGSSGNHTGTPSNSTDSTENNASDLTLSFPITFGTVCEACRSAEAYTGGFLCIDRIQKYVSDSGSNNPNTNLNATMKIVAKEFPETCGIACDPETCQRIPPLLFPPHEPLPPAILDGHFAKRRQRIWYKIQPKQPTNKSSNNENNDELLLRPNYPCWNRTDLADAVAKDKLNFTTTVSTNLKLLFMGDSVGIQILQQFSVAAGVTTHRQRHIMRYSWGQHEGLSLAPIRGGGLLAGWRLTGMLARANENRPLPNKPGGGWCQLDVGQLQSASSYFMVANGGDTQNTHSTNSGTNSSTINYDAMVFRPPDGWVGADTISYESFQETVELAHELFGVKTVIFVSLFFSNNNRTPEDVLDRHTANANLHKFARDWNFNHSQQQSYSRRTNDSTSGVQNILVLEFGNLMDELIERNARSMGHDTSTVATTQNYTMDRLSPDKKGISKSIPHVCAKKPVVHPLVSPPSCDLNVITSDGMHMCMETYGDSIVAGISCLLGCVHNEDSPSVDLVGECASKCNSQFMTLEDDRQF